MSDSFGHWLAGFIDGEGCFYIDARLEKGRRPRCQFIVQMRLDEVRALEEAKKFLGDIGSLKIRRNTAWQRPGANPSITWRVDDLDGLQRIVETFTAYPLRAKKASDFALWRKAVVLQAQYPDHRSHRGLAGAKNKAITDKIAAQIQLLGEELRANREYREPSCPVEYESLPK